MKNNVVIFFIVYFSATVLSVDIYLNPRIPDGNVTNLVPNSSFECGPAGWGSKGELAGSMGDLTGLFGKVVTENPYDGKYCLRIVMTPETTPVCITDSPYCDYVIQRNPMAGHIGWIDSIVNDRYVMSAYMRSSVDGIKAKLQFVLGSFTTNSVVGTRTQTVTLTTNWQRFTYNYPIPQKQMYVAVGPD